MYEHIRYEKDRGRVWVILNRPDKHNAISAIMHRELHDALWQADDDPEVHAVVIKGAGPSFCSGFDLGGYGQGERRPGRTLRATFDDDAWHIERGQRLDVTPFDLHKPFLPTCSIPRSSSFWTAWRASTITCSQRTSESLTWASS